MKREYQLEELLAGITPKNLHSESDFGKPVGKELI
jgi:antitoxin MazE